MRWKKILVFLVLLVCGLCVPFRALAALSADRGLYAACEATEQLYRIDGVTGAATLIGPIVSPDSAELSNGGLAYDTSTGTMYLSNISFGIDSYGLGRIDLATGALTIIGDHVNSERITGLAYDARNNLLYGSDRDAGGLATIDRATGLSTIVGSFGTSGDIYALAYCPANDTLYGASNDAIFTIDRATGTATFLGDHGVSISSQIGLGYDENTGRLFLSGNGDTNTYSVNMVTGEASLVGNTGIAIINAGGLASVPSQGNLSVLYINTANWNNQTTFIAGLEGMDIDGLSLAEPRMVEVSTAYMQNFDVVLVNHTVPIPNPVQLGDNLADYVDAGGAVGIFRIPLTLVPMPRLLEGRIITSDYSPLAPTAIDWDTSPSTATSFADHAITNGVTALTANSTTPFTTTQGGGNSLGTYDNGYLIGAYGDDRPIAVINVYPLNGNWSGDLMRMVENMVKWGADFNTSSANGGGSGSGCFISQLAF